MKLCIAPPTAVAGARSSPTISFRGRVTPELLLRTILGYINKFYHVFFIHVGPSKTMTSYASREDTFSIKLSVDAHAEIVML